ncbi:Sec20-domain-containing protein [Hypoxylon sp. FL1284]|nr:Sec20-domain-containing protein [Hypoxylon sp. FL1284]
MSPEALEKRFTDLQDRLAVLQDATSQLKELIDRLANFDFRPGSVPLGAGEDDDGGVGAEMGAGINQVLREQEEELELLREEITDVRPTKAGGGLQHDRDRLKDGASRLDLELQSCRKAFRRAQISAKRNLQLAQQQERELLYASFSNPRSGASTPAKSDNGAGTPTTSAAPGRRKPTRGKERSEMSREEQMLGASSDVTESMRRTHEMMAAELARSDFAHGALRESTAALSQLSDRYAGLDALLSSSRALVATLLRSHKTDTWYLQSAFYLLLATIAWLVFRRLLWGPAWWLLWLPLKLVFRLVAVTSRTALGRPGGGQVVGGPSAGQLMSQQQAYMNNEGVPTAQVRYASEKDPESSGSVMEEVGRIIDESAGEGSAETADDKEGQQDGQGSEGEEDTVLRERRGDEPPNPKKRMMTEEDTTGSTPQQQQQGEDGGSAERPRDEL